MSGTVNDVMMGGKKGGIGRFVRLGAIVEVLPWLVQSLPSSLAFSAHGSRHASHLHR